MSQMLDVSIQTTPKQLFGSASYTISVDVTNPTNTVINKVSVMPQYLPGRLILRELPIQSTLTGLESEKQSIARVMEKLAILANEKETSHKDGLVHEFTSLWKQIIRGTTFKFGYGPIYVNIDPEEFVLDTSEELFSIKSLNDVELLEKRFFSNEDDNSKEKKSFDFGKKKLFAKMSEIEKTEKNKKNLEEGYKIQPGETISYIFEVRAPTLLNATIYSLRFKISYGEKSFSEKTEVSFYPSPFATYIGGFLGGLAGFLIRVSLLGSSQIMWFTQTFWSSLAGSIILALVACAITVRTPNSKKVITTEDFIGGFVLGALVGLFSSSILDNIKKLIPTFTNT